MSTWKLVVEVSLPIPFVLVTLLCLPAPRAFQKGVLHVVDKTLGLTFLGSISLLHFMLVANGAALLATMKNTYELSHRSHIDSATQSPNIVANNLAKRWRGERNFWIAFICFTMWWLGAVPIMNSLQQLLIFFCITHSLLARLYHIMKHKVATEDKYERLVGNAPTSTAAKPVAVPTKPDAPVGTHNPVLRKTE